MALLWADNFGYYANADKATVYTQYVPGTLGDITIGAYGPSAGPGVRFRGTSSGGASGQLRRVLSSPVPSGSTFFARFKIEAVSAFSTFSNDVSQSDSVGGNSPACALAIRSGGSTLCWLKVNQNGTLSMYRGSTLITGATTPVALTQGVPMDVELKVVLHGSAGTIDICFGGDTGSPVVSVTGVNTTASGATTFDEIRLGSIGGPSGSFVECRLSNLIVWDGSGSTWNAFMGDHSVDWIATAAEGAHTDGAPSSGSDREAMVDEAAGDGDTSYNEKDTVGQKDSFTHAASPISGATISGVVLVAQARKSDVGSAGLKLGLRIGGTDYMGSQKTLGSTMSYVHQPLEVSPATSIAFDETEFNDSEFVDEKSA